MTTEIHEFFRTESAIASSEIEICAPPSKSHSHRAIFLAALSPGKSVIRNCLVSDDIFSTIHAVESFGAKVIFLRNDERSMDLEISGSSYPDFSSVCGNAIDCGNSGTTLRILIGIASLSEIPVTISGDSSLQKRPVFPLSECLKEGGGIVFKCGNAGNKTDNSQSGTISLPLTISGPCRGNVFRISGNVSSQFVTSLLIMAPLLGNDSKTKIIVSGKISSEPYIDITARMMEIAGILISRENNGSDAVFTVSGSYCPFEYDVPGDFSAAAFLMTAASFSSFLQVPAFSDVSEFSKIPELSMFPGKISVSGLDLSDPQGDKKIIEILNQAGVFTEVSAGCVHVRPMSERPKALELDMGNVPDLFPVVSVLLSIADGKSRLYGAPQLRFKESDRISATVEMINSLGGHALETDDGCIIEGVSKLSGGTIDHRGDHRIMMAAAVAALISENPVIMDDPECCRISYPDFLNDIEKIGISVRKR